MNPKLVARDGAIEQTTIHIDPADVIILRAENA
jgi:hypothetical protein